jgi:DNA (cytosine-5)-methyltransferase 1
VVLKIGSLFSGIGGLDLAVEAATGGETVWQVESVAYCRSVLARHWPDAECFDDVRGLSGLPAIDVLCGGFPCQDLSDVSPKRAGLDGERSGLFFEMVRIAAETRPATIIIENVPPLLKWRGVVESCFAAIGYGCRWTQLYASNAGAPHWRRRVFIVATPSSGFDLVAPMLDLDRTRRTVWPTPLAAEAKHASSGGGRRGGRSLGIAAGQTAGSGRLTPEWVAQLMGFVDGWIEPDGAPLSGFADRWPAGPDAEQFAWEAPRLMSGAAVPGRPARLKALGNAVVPQQALLALRHLL